MPQFIFYANYAFRFTRQLVAKMVLNGIYLFFYDLKAILSSTVSSSFFAISAFFKSAEVF